MANDASYPLANRRKTHFDPFSDRKHLHEVSIYRRIQVVGSRKLRTLSELARGVVAALQPRYVSRPPEGTNVREIGQFIRSVFCRRVVTRAPDPRHRRVPPKCTDEEGESRPSPQVQFRTTSGFAPLFIRHSRDGVHGLFGHERSSRSVGTYRPNAGDGVAKRLPWRGVLPVPHPGPSPLTTGAKPSREH